MHGVDVAVAEGALEEFALRHLGLARAASHAQAKFRSDWGKTVDSTRPDWTAKRCIRWSMRGVGAAIDAVDHDVLQRKIDLSGRAAYSELIGQALLILVECALKYDPDRAEFSTFACEWLQKNLARYNRRDFEIRPPEDKFGQPGAYPFTVSEHARVAKTDAQNRNFGDGGQTTTVSRIAAYEVDRDRDPEAGLDAMARRIAVERLPGEQRAIYRLHVAGFRQWEIAARLGLSEDQVWRRCALPVTNYAHFWTPAR
ncbi:hypothetical protein [Bradyrhizobium sp.]|uniref:hypothetical protein n=1 Tax=Bradyrhizobium sp. TaxID=376 RepID=UPI0025C2DF91|nr:hypothetical protein [Bradyrhizobium sp.]MBV8919292.1 sigma-70 region 4 domain-containing protein [Bradyrhizobium sp.]